MGEFSVSGIREELDSPELGKLFNRLKADCSYLTPFADWKAVIALLHDSKRGYRLKDRILWRLIKYYRQGGDNDRLGTVFIAIFTPAMGDIYRRWCGRRKAPRSGDDLSQEICLTLLAILKEKPITAERVAGKVKGALRNRLRALMDRDKEDRLRSSAWLPPEQIPDDAIAGPPDEDLAETMKLLDVLGVSSSRELLDLLARRRVITWEEKRLIEEALAKGKPLTRVARSGRGRPLDLRREKALQALGYHLRKFKK